MASHRVARGLVVVLLLSAAIGVACSPGNEPGAEPINEADSEVAGHGIGASVHFGAQLFQAGSLLPPAAFGTVTATGTTTSSPTPTPTPSSTASPSPSGTVTPVPSPTMTSTTSTPTPTPTPGGDMTDGDADGIPAGATYTFETTSAETVYGDGAASGVMTMTDANTSGADGAFTIALHLEIQVAANAPFDWDRAGIVVDGNVQGAAAVGTAQTFQVMSSLKSDYDIEIGNETRLVGDNSFWTMTYSPDTTWVPGQAMVAGGLLLDGASFLEVDGKQAASLISTTAPLRVDPACRQLLVSGAVTLLWSSDGKNREIQLEWTGCNTATVLYDETTITD